MKLLFIRTTGGMSGAEMYNVYLLKALQKVKAVTVHLLTDNLPFLRKLKKERIPSSLVFHPVAEAGTNRELLLSILWFYPVLFIYLYRIKQIEHGVRFDTVVLESMTEKLFLSPYLRLLGYRVIWIEHGPLFKTDRSALVKRLYIHKSKRPDAIIAVSEDTKKDLVKGGVSEKKVHVVHIGIRKIASPSTSLGIRNDNEKKQWAIGFLGSVSKEKGIIEFLDVADTLIRKLANTKFIVIGNGPLLPWAKEKVRTLKIQKNVSFTGYVDDVKKSLHYIDILFFPTRHHEGLSLALLEALAMGKIVVARDIGGNRELILNKKTGFLFHTEDEGRRILEDLISRKLSTAGIREAALEHVKKNFSIKKQIPKFIDIFHG